MSGHYLQVGLVLATHPKARKAGRAAMGFWLEGLLHSQIQEADGFVDESFLDGGWGTKREAIKLAQILCDVGLWSKVACGYQIAKFEKWNRLRTEIEDLRRRDRERKTNQKATKREPKANQIVTSLKPNVNQSETKREHDRNQSETDREPNESAAANDSLDLAKLSARNPPLDTNTDTDPNTDHILYERKPLALDKKISLPVSTRIDPKFQPKQETIEFLRMHGRNPTSDDVLKFVAHYEADGSKNALRPDWDAAFRKWVLNSFNDPRSARPRPSKVQQGLDPKVEEEIERAFAEAQRSAS